VCRVFYFGIGFATILLEVIYGIKEKAGVGFSNKDTLHKVESLLLSKAGRGISILLGWKGLYNSLSYIKSFLSQPYASYTQSTDLRERGV